MAPKKTYYYDYASTIPVVNENQPPKPSQPKQFTEIDRSHSQTNSNGTQAISRRPNVLPTILIIVLLVAIGYLAYSLFPKDYPSCSSFPGSKLSQGISATCTTFYGQTFSQSNPVAADSETFDISDNLDSDSFPLPEFPSPTPGLSDTTTESELTTKGGLPLETTAKPTAVPSKPTVSAGTDSGISDHPQDWIKHKYPTQKIALFLPPRFTSTNVTRNIDTGIQTFSLYDGNNQVAKMTIYPNWDDLTEIRNRSVTFMITDNTGVIKTSQNTNHSYYFEKFSQVYNFTCTIDSATCDQILKSLTYL